MKTYVAGHRGMVGGAILRKLEARGIETITVTGRCLVEVDLRYFRPTEVDLLIGDPTKAQTRLGWKHERVAREMVTEYLKVMQTATGMKDA